MYFKRNDGCATMRLQDVLWGRWEVMAAAIQRGIHKTGVLPGGLSVPRKACVPVLYYPRGGGLAGGVQRTSPARHVCQSSIILIRARGGSSNARPCFFFRVSWLFLRVKMSASGCNRLTYYAGCCPVSVAPF
jgi:hypothetical protein